MSRVPPADDATRTPVIGLIGGVASGKSFVARQFAGRGAAVIDADQIGHEVLRDPAVVEAARRQWGESILGADGQIDRRRLAAIVFAPPPAGPIQLQRLEALTHPEIGRRMDRQIEQLQHAGWPAIVLDAAVLVKAGWAGRCNRVVFVDAPPEVRLARAAARGWSPAEFARREAAQESLESKRRAADWAIDNSGDPAATSAQVDLLWRQLVQPVGQPEAPPEPPRR